MTDLKPAYLWTPTGPAPDAELRGLAAAYRAAGKRVVTTNGCFDLLHPGHMQFLQAARDLGDVLIVGLNSDRSVRELKGASRPLRPVDDRAVLLMSLGAVDHVVVFDERLPSNMLEIIQPDIHCKAGDYSIEAMPEAVVVRRYGGDVRILPYLSGYSTTQLVAQIGSPDKSGNGQAPAGAIVPTQGRIEAGPAPHPNAGRPVAGGRTLEQVLAAIAGCRILVVGDVMLDEYLWGDTRRISPEAPVPIVELRERGYALGAAGNVAANIASLGAQVALYGVVGQDAQGEQLRQIAEASGIDASGLLAVSGRPTTTKMRIMARGRQIARIDTESRRPLSTQLEMELLSAVQGHLANAEICVISDYEKGVVSRNLARGLITAAQEAGKLTVVDPKGEDFTRYAGASIVTPNLREAEMAVRPRLGPRNDVDYVSNALLSLLPGSAVLIKRGAEGMSLYCPAAAPLHLPATGRSVVDVTGAGDTVVACLAAALGAGAALPLAAWLANLAAGIAVGKAGTATANRQELQQEAAAAPGLPVLA